MSQVPIGPDQTETSHTQEGRLDHLTTEVVPHRDAYVEQKNLHGKELQFQPITTITSGLGW